MDEMDSLGERDWRRQQENLSDKEESRRRSKQLDSAAEEEQRWFEDVLGEDETWLPAPLGPSLEADPGNMT